MCIRCLAYILWALRQHTARESDASKRPSQALAVPAQPFHAHMSRPHALPPAWGEGPARAAARSDCPGGGAGGIALHGAEPRQHDLDLPGGHKLLKRLCWTLLRYIYVNFRLGFSSGIFLGKLGFLIRF